MEAQANKMKKFKEKILLFLVAYIVFSLFVTLLCILYVELKKIWAKVSTQCCRNSVQATPQTSYSQKTVK
jgi:hypothetical protein